MRDKNDLRPELSSRLSGAEFDAWYWSVEEMKVFCAAQDLVPSGPKATLRARIKSALDGVPRDPGPSRKPKKTNWSKITITPETKITEAISFGPAVRNYFHAQLGAKFVCHGDFMDWMRNHPEATFGDATEAWTLLELRKDDPSFRRQLAECNTYLRYLRALRDAHPSLTLDDAKRCWQSKKLRPAPGGHVLYAPSDLAFLES